MNSFGLLVGLTRLRLLAIFAGLAWLAGVEVPAASRALIVALAAAAVLLDVYLEVPPLRRTKTVPTQHTRI